MIDGKIKARHSFILYAIDDELLYYNLGVKFEVADPSILCDLLEIDRSRDANVDLLYFLDRDEMVRLRDALDIPFDSDETLFRLFRYKPPRYQFPYLAHGGYELPLLLQGRAKLAWMHVDTRFPRSLELKARFDKYVENGSLYSDGEMVPIDEVASVGNFHYAPVSEEWRIAARKLILRDSGLSGGWTEVHERLERMLMGYSDSEIKHWLEVQAESDSVLYGASFRCTVSRSGYEWVMHSGCRALPPMRDQSFLIYPCNSLDNEAIQKMFQDDAGIEAIVQFNIAGKYLMRFFDRDTTGPVPVPITVIPEINQHLLNKVRVVAVRPDASAE